MSPSTYDIPGSWKINTMLSWGKSAYVERKGLWCEVKWGDCRRWGGERWEGGGDVGVRSNRQGEAYLLWEGVKWGSDRVTATKAWRLEAANDVLQGCSYQEVLLLQTQLLTLEKLHVKQLVKPLDQIICHSLLWPLVKPLFFTLYVNSLSTLHHRSKWNHCFHQRQSISYINQTFVSS